MSEGNTDLDRALRAIDGIQLLGGWFAALHGRAVAAEAECERLRRELSELHGAGVIPVGSRWRNADDDDGA